MSDRTLWIRNRSYQLLHPEPHAATTSITTVWSSQTDTHVGSFLSQLLHSQLSANLQH